MTKQTDINYNFFYWGPLLFKIKLSPFDLEACAKLCTKKTKKFNKFLVGMIEHEHYVNPQTFQKILKPYLNIFKHAFKTWYKTPLGQEIIMSSAWVNFMKAGEFNPPHTHVECDFSSVLFIQVPQSLREEHKNFQKSEVSELQKGGGPGNIEFLYGERQPYGITQVTSFPEEGDLYIFPATLTHFVFPFKSKGERISVGANFNLK
tara:strand:- start:2173 stop:2787 length:615 start_codon:yes stop_codon:yes gene_type:complete